MQAKKLKEYFETNEFFITKAQGRSMLPMIRDGKDTVIIQRASDMSPLKKGDILLYEEPKTGRLMLHRLLKIQSDELTINGDNVVSWEYYRKADILGKLVEHHRQSSKNTLETLTYKCYVLLWAYNWPVRFTVIKTARRLKKYIKKCLNK